MSPRPRRNLPVDASDKQEDSSLSRETELLETAVLHTQHGDRSAFRQIFDLCQIQVYRVAVRMVGEQDAADVSQQVFLQIYNSIDLFRGQASFRTWVYRLTINECLQHLRRKARRKHGQLDWEPPAPNNELQRIEQRELLELALSRIAPELRSLFLLREIESLSYREIAEALNVPEGTVGSRLNRARYELKKQITELAGNT